MNESLDVPELSVVVVAYNERHSIERCLESLKRQQTRRLFEVILIDSSTDGTDEIALRYPSVRIKHFAERKYVGEARNAGIALARGGIIAFLDADCFVQSDWIEAVVRAHQSPYLAVGSAVLNGTPESLVSWAYYFCEFNLWLPQTKTKEITEMAGCGLSIKRFAFDQYGPFIEGTYCSDTVFLWRMGRDGHRVLFIPSIHVAHTVGQRFWGFLRHVVEHRRDFASVVVGEKKFSWRKRFTAAIGTVFLPFLLVPVIAWRVIKAEHMLRHFLLALPIILLGLLARAWGEFLGFAIPKASPIDRMPGHSN